MCMYIAFIVEFFHKCEVEFNWLNQCIMHIHCRYPDVHVFSENICLGNPNSGLSLHMSAKGDLAIKQCTIQADSSIMAVLSLG